MKFCITSKLALVIFSIGISACTTAKKIETKAPEKEDSAPVVTQIRPEFQQGVQWESVGDDRNGKCQLPSEKEKTEWKKLVAIAAACVAEKSWAKVEKLANQLMEQEADAAWGPYFLSLVAETKGAPARALWMADLAIKRAPTTAAFFYQRARLLWAMGGHQDAMAAMQKALEMDGNLSEGQAFVGQVYFRDHDYQKAQMHLEKASALGVRDPSVYAMLGETYLLNGNHLAAVDAFEKAVKADPKKVEFRLRQAYVYDELLQNKSEALTRYMAVQDLITRGTFAGKMSFNLSDKISNLKKLTAQMRGPADVSQTVGGRK